MTVFKFILPAGTWTAVAPGVERSGCLAVVAADTLEQARAILAADPDVDLRWIDRATVQRLDVTGPALLALVQ